MLGGHLAHAVRHIARSLLRRKTTEDTGEYVGELFHLFKPLLVGYLQRFRQTSVCPSRIVS